MRDIIKKILKEETGEGGDIDKRYNQPLEEGDIIQLIYMDDPYNPISPLTKGIVRGFERVPGGEDKILVTWIVDPENDKLFNMPMIPEVDVWMKLDVDPPTMQTTPTGRDSRTTIGNPLRLREQSDEIPTDTSSLVWDPDTQTHVPRAVPSKTIFFKAAKQLLKSNPDMFAGEYYLENPYERGDDMSNVLKLFGINPYNEDLTSKIYWAAFDNQQGISDGSINSYDELTLRPLKEYRITCEESITEHAWYTWQPRVEAYDQTDAEEMVNHDDDGYYAWWEWDNEPGFDKEVGDTDGEGKEITDIEEVKQVESKNLTEAEGPEENELVDGLRDILHKQKEAHSEDRWYNDIEKLLKRLDIPLQEGFVSHSYQPNIGDNVKNNNPGCIHYGSEGVIEDIEDLADDVGKTITYRVTNDGENYENGDTLTKTMDQLIPLKEQTSILPPDEEKLTELDARILNHLFKELGCTAIEEAVNEPPYETANVIESVTKLYGFDVTDPSKVNYGKQLIQFMVNKGCTDDYTSFIGESLPPINDYKIGQNFIEWDKMEKNAIINIQDTNFKAAMCAAREHFWDYDVDVFDEQALESDYVGDEQWTFVSENGKDKWNRHTSSSSDPKFNPDEMGCE